MFAAAGPVAAAVQVAVVVGAIAVALAIVWVLARSLLRPQSEHPPKAAQTDIENLIAQARDREAARLRLLVNDMFETMARRNRALVDQQLSLIDRLERNEHDPDRLDSLFRLDHLAAQMRRNGANLLVLAGAQTSREGTSALPLATVISAATSEVEGYRRVETATLPEVTVTGAASGDTAHLLAELIDNALRYSPPLSPVRVTAGRSDDGGVCVEVVDAGRGVTGAELRLANIRLSADDEVTPEHARHMGLFVVGRLARRHGIRVRLRTQSFGIVAEVLLPPGLLVGG